MDDLDFPSPSDPVPDHMPLNVTGRLTRTTTIVEILKFCSPQACFLCGREHFPIPAGNFGEMVHTNLCRKCRMKPDVQELKRLEVQRRLANSDMPMMPMTQVPSHVVIDSLSKEVVEQTKKDPTFTKRLLRKMVKP